MDIKMAPPNEFYSGFEGGSEYKKVMVQFHQSVVDVSSSSCKEDKKEDWDN
jgi:hypothetical protein